MVMKMTRRFCVLTSSIIAVVANNISAQYSPTWVVKRAELTRRRTRIASMRSAICTSCVSGFTTSIPPAGRLVQGISPAQPSAIAHPMQATTAHGTAIASVARRRKLRSSTSTSNPASATTISGAVKRRSSVARAGHLHAPRRSCSNNGPLRLGRIKSISSLG
jgi:hypothetical protein